MQKGMRVRRRGQNARKDSRGQLLRIVACVAALALALSGCGRKREPDAAEGDGASVRETVLVAQPQEAVDEIYDSLEDYDADALVDWLIIDSFGLEPSSLQEYYGKISNVNDGLADVAILKPEPDKREDVQRALSKYKEKRIAEFENYDILGAYAIAQGAVIYDQGEYVILLMLADNAAARTIIDKYIPL